MHRKYHQLNIKKVVIPILGIATSLGLSALLPINDTYADIGVPSVTIDILPSSNSATVKPASGEAKFASFTTAINFEIANSEDFAIYIRGAKKTEPALTSEMENGNVDCTDLPGDRCTGTENLSKVGNPNIKIKSLVHSSGYTSTGLSEEAFKALGESAWGYRWVQEPQSVASGNVSDKNFFGIAADGVSTKLANPVAGLDGDYIVAGDGIYRGRLTLEFATTVSSDQQGGSYSSNVAIAIVANPRKISILDPEIQTMQDLAMNPDACENTPTPAATALEHSVTSSATGSINAPRVGTPAADYSNYAMTYEGLRGQYKMSYATLVEIDRKAKTSNNTLENGIPFIPEKELVDTRDGKTYMIRKMADGNCWMTRNLAFAPGLGTTLTAEETDFDDSTIKEWTVEKETVNGHLVDTIYATGNASNGWVTPWGSYYSWLAATVGDSPNITEVGAKTTRSICPRGWTLPDEAQQSALMSIYKLGAEDQPGNQGMTDKFPFDLVLSGTVGNVGTMGVDGYWWGSGIYSESISEQPSIIAIYRNPTTNAFENYIVGYTKNWPFSIRCIAR